MATKRLITILTLATASQALAGSQDQARKMYNRLAGVPPTTQELQQMTQKIDAGDLKGAAMIPIETETFLSITVKQFAAPMTNVDGSLDVPLNDMSATIIGMVKDRVPFDRILFDDVLYTGDDNYSATTPYSTTTNDHFARFETSGLSYKTNLVTRQQSSLSGLSISAGVMTLRAFGDAYYNAGTNRRAVRYTLKNFICRDIEKLTDNTRSDMFIRRDVDRAPAGVPATFRAQCAGCHAGMDPLSKAFANFDFVGNRITYTPNTIPDKINRNADVFPLGYVTQDDNWRNLWIEGPNQSVGWNGASEGKGPVEFGHMVAATDSFPTCMAEKVFQKVCLRTPTTDDEKSVISDLADGFKANNYDMKDLFAQAATRCL